MRDSLKQLQRYILKLLARAIIWRYRPGIVGITGSVGKTSAKRAIAAVLKSDRYVRESPGNFNNELGLPLTILGSYDKIGGPFFWIKAVLKALWKLIFKSKYPELLILEYGVDKPGDMRYLLSIAKPNIAVVTAIGEIPAHVEFFAGPDNVAREKSRLIEFLPSAGFAILNHDDFTVMGMKDRTRAKVVSFGFGPMATMRISNFENQSNTRGTSPDRGKKPEGFLPHEAGTSNGMGISFKLEYGGSFVPVRLSGVFGKTHAYAASSAACVGLIFGVNLVKIAENLTNNYKPLAGRSALIKGIKDTLIIDDSYNASPMAMHAALDTLKSLHAKRKIAVLGDMLEIGEYAPEAHEEMGRLAAKSAQILFTIGPRAKFIAEGAKKSKMQKKYIFSFDTADSARIAVQDALRKGDLVLVKASRAMQLDKIVEEIKFPEELK